ncbi:type III secretion system protein [Escherichia coli]|nr:type III secretion system protein [Escherichia coli]
MSNSISLIAILSLFTLLPFIIASGTCFIKFSIVFVIVRNALGLQQVPSNMTLNGVALLLSMFVMMPVGKEIYNNSQNENLSFNNVASVVNFVETGMSGYKSYLIKYSEPELVSFFEKIQKVNSSEDNEEIIDDDNISIFSLLPAYALSEIKSAFIIGFYIYLPFVVVDLVISSVLLTLGMMMMSPVTISTPIKLILFVAMDGWTMLSKGLILQYFDLSINPWGKNMDDIVFAGNRALYLILVMSAGPIAVATFVGLLVGLFQTVTQLQEQTLPFGVKLLCVSICFFLMSGWYGEKLYSFGI